MASAASIILEYYRQYLNIDTEKIGTAQNPLPCFPKEMILEILQKTVNILTQEGSLVHIKGNVHVVGDLHGNIFDLIRLLSRIGQNFDSPIVFLGDYVDRGKFSTEVVTLLFALKVLYPQNIVLIRGNHEFREVNAAYGFKNEVISIYSEDIWEGFNNAFDCLPFAAIINNQFFCVHGGISPHLRTIDNVKDLTHPVNDYSSSNNEKLLKDLMWSDPTPLPLTFTPSNRGVGSIYGMTAVKQFLQANNLKAIIRGHQYIFEGVLNMHNIVYTVFSSSSYLAKAVPNSCGLLLVHEDLTVTYDQFKPLKVPARTDCEFRNVTPHRSVHHDSMRAIKLLPITPSLIKPSVSGLSVISGRSSRIRNFTPQPVVLNKLRSVTSNTVIKKTPHPPIAIDVPV